VAGQGDGAVVSLGGDAHGPGANPSHQAFDRIDGQRLRSFRAEQPRAALEQLGGQRRTIRTGARHRVPGHEAPATRQRERSASDGPLARAAVGDHTRVA
jgi:hypothetical protein